VISDPVRAELLFDDVAIERTADEEFVLGVLVRNVVDSFDDAGSAFDGHSLTDPRAPYELERQLTLEVPLVDRDEGAHRSEPLGRGVPLGANCDGQRHVGKHTRARQVARRRSRILARASMRTVQLDAGVRGPAATPFERGTRSLLAADVPPSTARARSSS
jgi:hypothetical protein